MMRFKLIASILLALSVMLKTNAFAQVKSHFDKHQTLITEMILSTSDERELEKMSFEKIKEESEQKDNLVNVFDL